MWFDITIDRNWIVLEKIPNIEKVALRILHQCLIHELLPNLIFQRSFPWDAGRYKDAHTLTNFLTTIYFDYREIVIVNR